MNIPSKTGKKNEKIKCLLLKFTCEKKRYSESMRVFLAFLANRQCELYIIRRVSPIKEVKEEIYIKKMQFGKEMRTLHANDKRRTSINRITIAKERRIKQDRAFSRNSQASAKQKAQAKIGKADNKNCNFRKVLYELPKTTNGMRRGGGVHNVYK